MPTPSPTSIYIILTEKETKIQTVNLIAAFSSEMGFEGLITPKSRPTLNFFCKVLEVISK